MELTVVISLATPVTEAAMISGHPFVSKSAGADGFTRLISVPPSHCGRSDGYFKSFFSAAMF